MTISTILCVLFGFFLGLLLCKHDITNFDKAKTPFKNLFKWITGLFTNKEKSNAETKEDNEKR